MPTIIPAGKEHDQWYENTNGLHGCSDFYVCSDCWDNNENAALSSFGLEAWMQGEPNGDSTVDCGDIPTEIEGLCCESCGSDLTIEDFKGDK